jgi:hydrogenase maturation protein HypF
VQGVGFRPFIYNEAIKNNIKGTVQNTGDGVEIICNNKESILRILKTPPKLSKIEKIKIEEVLNLPDFKDFKILESETSNSYSPIPADLNLCSDCIKEMFEVNNQRYKYFFISCINCGPRYSIIKSTPYDRKKTTLDFFNICKFCNEEFKDPTNRRFHAQTIACPDCGPQLSLYKNGIKIEGSCPIEEVAKLINKNEVVAIKGIGGFHLACSIEDEAILRLKKITQRFHKPFALMVKNVAMIEGYAKISKNGLELLQSKERPIVLLEKKDSNILKEISELSSLGFMLPYSGVHYLLFEHLDSPIVLTSSNLPSFPITTKKEEQFTDYVLDYNRDISNSVDDSIIKVIGNEKLIIRRSRGFAPNEIEIPKNYLNFSEDILSVGAELKNTFCIKKNDKLILSEHIGNTYNLENFENFKSRIFKLMEFTKSTPKIILRDSNVNFNTSQFAEEFSKEKNIELFNIQHHIAHGFSVALEHDLKDFLAIVCDGLGLGEDGTAWGGEVFHNDKRIGHLEYQSLVGGEIANKEPRRILVGILAKFMKLNEIEKILGESLEIKTYFEQKKQNFNCVETSSVGRILDCVSVLLGFSDKNYYEGRGAMLLESNSSSKIKLFFEPIIEKENNLFILKTTPLFEFIKNNLDKISREELARFAQIYIAKGLFEIAKKYDEKLPVVFSGGVAYNEIITSFMIKNKVLLNKDIPCGDGGISAGQIAYFLWKEKNKN